MNITPQDVALDALNILSRQIAAGRPPENPWEEYDSFEGFEDAETYAEEVGQYREAIAIARSWIEAELSAGREWPDLRQMAVPPSEREGQ